jgi:hypothetical protein
LAGRPLSSALGVESSSILVTAPAEAGRLIASVSMLDALSGSADVNEDAASMYVLHTALHDPHAVVGAVGGLKIDCAAVRSAATVGSNSGSVPEV